jgi:O-methyltransferase
MTLMNRAPRFNISDRMDYVRLSSLELCAYEIQERQIKGSVAELGVYQGDYSEKINLAFPDRKLYLFDTFEGFDKRDTAIDTSHKFSDGKQDFSTTSVDAVLSKMKYPSNCIVRKGYFPESAEGVDDTFCFVSLDVDLYQPTIEGLTYFYARLVPGGYIFVHDYNNDLYKGVKQAVREFSANHNVPFFPLPDGAGSAVICK